MTFIDMKIPNEADRARMEYIYMTIEDDLIKSKGGAPMDLGVRLCYLIWASQEHWDGDRKIHVNVVKNIYPELAKTSPLFSYWEKSGVRADDVVRMLTHEHHSTA